MSKALEGVRVLDFGHVQAGPTATQLLAWMGADVIKIEMPGRGDITRGQLQDVKGADSLYFTMLNSNKRSITVNLKAPGGRKIIEDLVKRCDVILENFGPGVLDRQGFTWERFQELNPRVIYASIKGFGPGPYADCKAYENVAQCMGGSASTTGWEDGPPTVTGAQIGDSGTGVHTIAGILAALYQRERTGRGLAVGSSLLANGLWANGCAVQARLCGEVVEPQPERHASPHPLRNHYRCRDGKWLLLSLVPDEARWQRFKRALAAPGLDDARFASAESRAANAPALTAALDLAFSARDRNAWCAALEPTGLVFGIVSEMDDIPDAQMLASGALVAFEGDTMLTVNSPFWLEGETKLAPRRAPEAGENGAEVLRAVGYSDAEIEALRAARVTT
jgi:formyl-CoA transferase